VMVLGDSLTEAVQVPWRQNFCSVLEMQLNQFDLFRGMSVTVINAGVSGYSPIAEYQYFHRELKKFRPNMVVLQVFANDVFEDHRARAMAILDYQEMPVVINRFFSECVELPQENGLLVKFKEFLLMQSCLAETVSQVFYKQLKAAKFQKKMEVLPEYSGNNKMFIIDETSVLFRDIVFREKALLDSLRYIKALRQEVEGNGVGAKFVLMIIPHEAQLSRKKYNEHVYRYFKNLPASLFFNKRLAEFCSLEGIDFLDLSPVFEMHLSDELYWPNDGHLRPEGHNLVGLTLAEFIKNILK